MEIRVLLFFVSFLVLGKAVVRRATQNDKKEILSIPQNIPTDYLPAYFDFMMTADNRECYIAEIDEKIVGFAALAYIDGGRTCQAHSLRIHRDYEKQGILRLMAARAIEEAKKSNCSVFNFVMYIAQSKYLHLHMHRLYTKANFFTDIGTRYREYLIKEVNKKVHIISEKAANDVSSFIEKEPAKQYLFPCNRVLVDQLVYTARKKNVPLLLGRSTQFYSTFKADDVTDICSGLLSAGRFYECPTTAGYFMYVIDLFGSDKHDAEKYINFHLNLAFANISGPFFFEVNVDEGDITGIVCSFLSKMGFEVKMNTSVLLATYLK